MARGNPDKRSAVARRLADVVDEAADKVARKVDEKRDQAAAKLDQKHRLVTTKLEEKRGQVLSRLDGVPDLHGRTEDGSAYAIWLRDRPGSRKPRHTHDDIAEAALRVVDAEGLDALSMRRLATELGAGTMTLYHYVRTKDELLALLADRVMAELLVPEDEFPDNWREALTAIAQRTRGVMQRHPWMFDMAVDPTIGPNGVRHFDQSLQAVASLDLGFAERLDILTAVDEFTFGHCLHARGDASHEGDDDRWREMSDYVVSLAAEGGLPQVSALIDQHGPDQLWRLMADYESDDTRFDRNLRRILDGIERDLPRRRKATRGGNT